MTADELDFRKLHYKSPATYDRNWLEWFREEFARRVFGVDMEPKPGVPFRLEGTTRLLPGLAVYHGECSPVLSRVVPGASADHLVMMTVALDGDMSIRTGGRDFELKPGTAIAGSGELQGVLDIRSDARFLSLSLSRSQIAGLVPNISSLGGILIPPGSQPLRLLLGYVRMLDAEETIASPEARRLLSAHVHDLAALAIGASGDATVLAEGRGVRAARLAAIKAYILDNLARPDLSVAIVAAQQEVTPRYVHMLFETDGVTFSEYVTTQRLTRAQRILRDSRFAHQTIAAIALSVGFGDLSYFNRTFRRRFGMTPSDAREQARRGGGR